MKKSLNLAKNLLLKLIKLYQKTVSPDHGMISYKFPYGVCRYHPTCSVYAYQAIERHGIVKGILLAVKRVLRCNPFASGGYDPLPGSTGYNSRPKIIR